ncbi:MAG: hypothetical protein AAE977_03125 [Thermoplasmataceae archaeon]|jgi:hypothetical protein
MTTGDKGRSLDRLIQEKRRSYELKTIPEVLIPVWQIKLRERFGINVDREIASYVVMAAHEQGTWKRYRAIKRIEKLLRARGESPERSSRLAREIVEISVGINY